MTTGSPRSRHFIERRVRGERRSGLDRRIAERRFQAVPVRVERRAPVGRRRRERRSPMPRRSGIDRRGSAIELDLTEP
jgi:hypothetical protein